MLKYEPRLEIMLAENRFVVLDDSAYNTIKYLELNKNWFRFLLRPLSWFLYLITFNSPGKKRTNLKIIMDKQILKLWLIDSAMEIAEVVMQKLNGKKPTLDYV